MFPVHLQKPTPILGRFVQFYTQRELRLRDPLFIQAVPARAAPMLEFIFGDPLKIRYPGSPVEHKSPDAVFVGMLTRPHGELRLQGTLVSFVIMFQPAGLSALFRVGLQELTDRSIDARSVAGPPIAELQERLAECDSFASRVNVANTILSRRVPESFKADPLWTAVDSMLEGAGRGRISELAAFTGTSNRQFERRFNARFGMRPKLYARMVRFQSALDSKARSTTKSWTDVAHEFGYHDQMHMIHDFKEVTGTSPGETLLLVEAFFRHHIDAIRAGTRAKHPGSLPRLVI